MTWLRCSVEIQMRLFVCLKSALSVSHQSWLLKWWWIKHQKVKIVKGQVTQIVLATQGIPVIQKSKHPKIMVTGSLYRWQTVGKKICKAKIEMSFNTAIEMFKEEVAVLKEHIHIKRRQVNAYREMKYSLKDDDLMDQVDFAESCKNEQQDAIQSAYFGNQCFSIFTVSCYS